MEIRMTGKSYYITTLGDWHRHAARFANSHWIALNSRAPNENPALPNADAKILVLIEADEGVHLALESEPAFEALPHPLAQKPISDAAQSALAPHGVAPGATTFDAAEALARVHPLLRHRVF
jgi:hypothetical protein